MVNSVNCLHSLMAYLMENARNPYRVMRTNQKAIFRLRWEKIKKNWKTCFFVLKYLDLVKKLGNLSSNCIIKACSLDMNSSRPSFSQGDSLGFLLNTTLLHKIDNQTITVSEN